MTDAPDTPAPPNANPMSPAQGETLPTETADRIAASVELVFDYRGDVTIHTVDGATHEGYVFDRDKESIEPSLRLMPATGGGNVAIRYADIVKIVVSGRDTASGKSFETWLKKYQEAKAKGETADWPIEGVDGE